MSSITSFIKHHYRHFNAAALIDAADAYNELLASGGKMFVTIGGAMSTAELGLSLAEMIRPAPAPILKKTSSTWWRTIFTSAFPTTAI
jgi:deoxyhypusine synthase